MSIDRKLLEQCRDQALRDIVGLERQVADREIPEEAAQKLRRRYEATAAHALGALASLPPSEHQEAPRPSRRSRARIVAYVAAAAVAVFAAVLLPQYVATRPDGGFVTGNEVAQTPAGPAPASRAPAPRDLSTVSAAEMEGVVKANPTVVGMRLALADRYLEKGNYDKAAEHYGVALKQDPGNPEVQAGAGWLLFKMGQTGAALRFVDQALNIAPTMQDALWFKANILLGGRKDPAAALAILRTLAQRGDLGRDLREQVRRLITEAERAGGQ
ncbi:cytochrome C biosynthesis protein [Prauserella sp. PE36]|uniref:tetratricopeptide repeat protein n=1 Tax=Prauserella sp. PE36 TaxID=1504709 RepID=UPI000DE38BF9|nr:tetratricopeptide repeat protein [Prauserella sp. PE36]RBM17440.1 cytochrome C biosynthesis protein [Prauserella sp. PE36]